MARLRQWSCPGPASSWVPWPVMEQAAGPRGNIFRRPMVESLVRNGSVILQARIHTVQRQTMPRRCAKDSHKRVCLGLVCVGNGTSVSRIPHQRLDEGSWRGGTALIPSIWHGRSALAVPPVHVKPRLHPVSRPRQFLSCQFLFESDPVSWPRQFLFCQFLFERDPVSRPRRRAHP
jgi:hypothetical protein